MAGARGCRLPPIQLCWAAPARKDGRTSMMSLVTDGRVGLNFKRKLNFSLCGLPGAPENDCGREEDRSWVFIREKKIKAQVWGSGRGFPASSRVIHLRKT